MQRKRFLTRYAAFFLALPILLTLCPLPCSGATYQVLYSFSGDDGAGPYSSVVFDSKGNLYGTTAGGGAYGYGTVFKLKPGPGGIWTEKVLHSFDWDAWDYGFAPWAGVILDSAHNIYGVTHDGGISAGVVFQLTPGDGGWTENVLHSFGENPDDAGFPYTGVIMDKVGNLYGAAPRGGPNGAGGTVYQLKPGPNGWTETILYGFCAQPQCSDGDGPDSDLTMDAKGNLYGTTGGGGNYPPACPVSLGCGVVFKLKPMPDGSWKFRVLHRFAAFPEDGVDPADKLAMDSAGNLYGTTGQGGKYICFGTMGCGTIYKLTRQPNGHWKETILHHFRQNKQGYLPSAGVVRDQAGNLYGTTGYGGDDPCSCGVVYKLSPNPDGTWSYTVLHNFTGDDGFAPAANLIFDDQGNLYGTTILGGPGGAGVVFKLTP